MNTTTSPDTSETDSTMEISTTPREGNQRKIKEAEDLSRPTKRTRHSSYEFMAWMCDVCGHENLGTDSNCGLCWQSKNNAVFSDLTQRLSCEEDALELMVDEKEKDEESCSSATLNKQSSSIADLTITPSRHKKMSIDSHYQSKGYHVIRLILSCNRNILSCVDRARLRCVAQVDKDQDDSELTIISRCVSLDTSPSNASLLMKHRVARLLDLGYKIRSDIEQLLTLQTPSARIRVITKDRKFMQEFEKVLPSISVRRASLVFLVHDRFVVDLAFGFRTTGMHLARTLFSTCGVALSHAPEKYRDEKSVVMCAVEHTGLTLQIASERLRNDFDLVLTAVSNDGHALQYASENLQNNRRIVMAAVEQSGTALQYASVRIQDDPVVVLEAVRSDGNSIHYVSPRLRNSGDLMMAAMSHSGTALFWHSSLRENNSSPRN